MIHPGGRASTDRLFAVADVQPGERVLDIGCGVGTTAIRLAKECGSEVVDADIAPLMRERAVANVSAARLKDRVQVQDADILALPYPDDSFDVVVAEAVTMFVSRRRADMMTARGLLVDEGAHAIAVMAKAMSRLAYLRKMAWLVPRMSRVVPYLGYVLVMVNKPQPTTPRVSG